MAEKVKTVKEFFNKEKCDCNKVAIYFYMPGYTGKKEEQNYYCEDCVPRGCSCEWNYIEEEDYKPEGVEGVDWKWLERVADEQYEEIKKGEIWVYIDKQGREYPCCEFMWSEDGWDKE